MSTSRAQCKDRSPLANIWVLLTRLGCKALWCVESRVLLTRLGCQVLWCAEDRVLLTRLGCQVLWCAESRVLLTRLGCKVLWCAESRVLLTRLGKCEAYSVSWTEVGESSGGIMDSGPVLRAPGFILAWDFLGERPSFSSFWIFLTTLWLDSVSFLVEVS